MSQFMNFLYLFEFQSLVFNPATQSILKDIFLVKRVETMIENFTLILQVACSFKGTGISPVYDDEQLCRAVRKYLTDFVSRKMLGLQSYCVSFILCNLLHAMNIDINNEINLVDIGAQNVISMEELCRKAVEKTIKHEKITSITVNQATGLCWGLEVAWRKLCTIQNIQNQVNGQRNSLVRLQLILTAHFWMYEEAIATQQGFAVVLTTRNRATVMLQLDENIKVLLQLKTSIQKHRDELLVLINAINQRLKWAVGANINLMELMNEFMNAISARQDLMDKAFDLAAITLKECTSILQYEKLRVSTPEALEDDQKFLNLVSRWEKSCMMAQSCASAVTPVEEALIELLDPEGPIDRMWLNNVASLVDEMLDQVQQDISKTEKDIVNTQDELQSCAYRLRALMVTHHRIAAKVLTLLKMVYRIADDNQKALITQQLDKHNGMLEMVSELHGHILSKDFTEELVNGTLNQISELLDTIKDIFNTLIDVDGFLAKDATVDLEHNKKLGIFTTPTLAQIQQQNIGVSRPNSPSRNKNQKGKLIIF